MIAAIKIPYLQSNGGWFWGQLIPTTVIERTYTLKEKVTAQDDPTG